MKIYIPRDAAARALGADEVRQTVADFRLDNGLRVLVAPKAGLPLVSARLSFDAGTADEVAGKTGVAALTAALLCNLHRLRERKGFMAIGALRR